MKRNIWYFGLEPLQERYTYQLSTLWMPKAFEKYEEDFTFINVKGVEISNNIKIGNVLDACGRGIYSMSQCSNFLESINEGLVKDNDIIFLQDFWTPGIESIFYALDLYGIKIKLYSMLHAQSVDEYDFTYGMRNWMRGFELGLDKYHSAIFVGSSIHKEQLRAAGFNAPIHVMSLPIDNPQVGSEKDTSIKKENQIIYTSRLDKEKNPFFLLEFAKAFLNKYKDYKFILTTSGNDFKSSDPNAISYLKEFAEKEKRFIMMRGLSKSEYYIELQKSKIQFNCSLQDYVSWTLIESSIFDCDVVYPDFRSFPEILPKDRMYSPFKIDDALRVVDNCIINPNIHKYIGEISDIGRRLEAFIVCNDIVDVEYNVWHEHFKFKNV